MIRKSFGMGFAFCIANTALLPVSQAQAQTKASVPDESLFGDNTVRLDEEDDLQISARLTIEGSLLEDIDLDSLTDDSQARIQPEARVDVLYTPDDDIEILASVEAGFDLDRRTGQWDSIERLEIRELNIGHFLIGEAVFVGLAAAVRRMRGAMEAAQ